MNDTVLLSIAVTLIKDHVPPPPISLEERMKAVMKYVKEHKDDLFFLAGADDDLMFRTSIAAVILAPDTTQEEKDTLERSIMHVRMMSALLHGVPVDLSAAPKGQTIPLLGIWHDV